MEKKNLKCPICGTVQPYDVDFCVYCAMIFDKETVKRVDTPLFKNDEKSSHDE